MGLLSLFIVLLCAMVWNYKYGYSLTQIKHILSGKYIYDAEQGDFTYIGELYIPNDLSLDAKFFDAGNMNLNLSTYGEPVLFSYEPEEDEVVFRFCADSCCESARIYRIHINEREKSGYVVYNGNIYIDLNAQQCDAILDIFSDENFWNQKSFHNIYISHALEFIMEGKRGEQYHLIERYPHYHTGLTEFESIIGGIPK